MAMKYRYVINSQSYVVVTEINGWYHGEHFKNGCSRNLMDKYTQTLEEMEYWINELKEVLNG